MRKAHSVYNRPETLSHLTPKIWSLVPHSLYHLVILYQNPKNGLGLIVPADYAKHIYIK